MPWPLTVGLLVLSLALSFLGVVCPRSPRLASTFILPVVCLGILSSALLCGILLGTWRLDDIANRGLQGQPGPLLATRVVVTGEVSESSGWQSAPAQLLDNKKAVYLELAPVASEALGISLVQGDVLRVTGSLLLPSGPSASGYDQAKRLAREGIHLVLRVNDPDGVAVLGKRGGLSGFFDRVRNRVRSHLRAGPEPRAGEVLLGALLGETRGIDKAWLEAFRRAGTAHMFSVSGLHVASLVAVMMILASLFRLPARVGLVLGAAAALFMVPLVGASPPIVRATAMVLVLLVGRLMGRRRDSWQALSLAAVVVLGLDPNAVFEVGFQLSFAALTGILALSSRLQHRLRRLPHPVAAGLAVSLAASLGTTPVSLLVFGRASLVGPLANLLVVPLLPLITGLGMASAVLGFVWTGFSVGLDALVSVPVYWVVLVSRVCSLVPVLGRGQVGALLLAVGCSLAALPAALALCGMQVCLPLRTPLEKRLNDSRLLKWLRAHRPRRRRVALVSAAAVVIAAFSWGGFLLPLAAQEAKSVVLRAVGEGWPDGVEVRVLDVGQGNAVLVRTPGHKALLFDGGPRGCRLRDQLVSLGVSRLEVVVISHPHLDHFGGLAEVLDGLHLGVLVDNVVVEGAAGHEPEDREGVRGASTGQSQSTTPERAISSRWTTGSASEREAAMYVEMRESLREKGVQVATVASSWTLEVDGVTVRFFAPHRPLVIMAGAHPWQARGGPPSGEELNASSLVALLTVGQTDFLLPGDAEAEVLERYQLPSSCEVLVVPHHGSRGAVSPSLLGKVGASLAIITVGSNNSFGHPDAATLGLLQEAVPLTLRTDHCGWVSCAVVNDTIRVRSERIPGP